MAATFPSGHLVYVHQGVLFGVGFDPARAGSSGHAHSSRRIGREFQSGRRPALFRGRPAGPGHWFTCQERGQRRTGPSCWWTAPARPRPF